MSLGRVISWDKTQELKDGPLVLEIQDKLPFEAILPIVKFSQKVNETVRIERVHLSKERPDLTYLYDVRALAQEDEYVYDKAMRIIVPKGYKLVVSVTNELGVGRASAMVDCEQGSVG